MSQIYRRLASDYGLNPTYALNESPLQSSWKKEIIRSFPRGKSAQGIIRFVSQTTEPHWSAYDAAIGQGRWIFLSRLGDVDAFRWTGTERRDGSRRY